MQEKKYIVYMTINLVNGKFYIGVHGTFEPYRFDGYIGNGIKGENSKEIRYPVEPFHYAVKKYGFKNFKRITLAVYDTKEEALEHEKLIVTERFIQRNDTYNFVVGGGMPPILEIPIHEYDLDGNYIRSFKSATVAGINYNCGGANIGTAARAKRTSMNKLWSFEKVDKLDISQYYINRQAIAVYTSNIHNDIIKEYGSMGECARDLKTDLSVVQRAVKNKTDIKGLYIHYATDSYTTNCKRVPRKVGQYDQEGNLIKVYDTVRACKKEFTNVNKVLRGQAKHCRGYFFKYIEE